MTYKTKEDLNKSELTNEMYNKQNKNKHGRHINISTSDT